MKRAEMRAALTRAIPAWAKEPAKRVLPGAHVQYSTAFSDRQWLHLLRSEIRRAVEMGASTIVALHRSDDQHAAAKALRDAPEGTRVVIVDADAAAFQAEAASISALLPADMPPDASDHVAFVACSTRDADVRRWLDLVLRDPTYRPSNFIFKVRPSDSIGALADRPVARDLPFVSSVFDDDIIRDVYRFSISRVEEKYDVRDAYDLYQALVATLPIPGAVCEFGSYRGHSGLILSEAIRRLKAEKQVYLCDAFEEFPAEGMAVDKFWNDSHQVDFKAVQELFRPYEFVTLVKGDFTKTLPSLPVGQLSLVHVDCDSYRAVQLVSEFAYPRLAPGGVMVYEDYGHDFCLGARAAVEDFYRSRPDSFRFFSGFSGLELVVKR